MDSICLLPHIIPFDIDELLSDNNPQTIINNTHHDILGVVRNMTTDITPPFQISLGSDSFDNIVENNISTHGKHPTLYLQLHESKNIGHRIQLVDISKSAPATRIPRWRSTIRSSFPLSMGDTSITTHYSLDADTRKSRQNNLPTIHIKFGLMQKTAMHPHNGVS